MNVMSIINEVMDLIPNLPAGPLDEYRKLASFDWKQMRVRMEQPERLRIKMRVWSYIDSESIFKEKAKSTEEEKRLTAKQLVKFLCFSGLFKDIENLNYQERTLYLMTVNEATEIYSPSLSIKFALGVSLFANALLNLGTERHLQYYKDVWSGKIFSCLAITELGHGSDTKRFKTTATYDHKMKEFVINTPGIEAAKCWVGNLGKQCTHALLFAQLIVNDICHGLHCFVVPIRDPLTMLPYDNLTVGDVGEKSGLHGIDNGFILFRNYRIPRGNLLNRTGDINDAGEYETTFKDPQRILGAALESLSAGRVAIIQESCSSITKAIVIAIRYAAQRKQFADACNNEIPLIEYQTHQWRLFPYVAAGFAIKAFIEKFSSDYINCVAVSREGSMDMQQMTLMVTGVHALVCCCKSVITWICRDAIQESREACGGHGYHKAAGLGDLRNNHDIRVTFEGDNTVLLIQTSNWLLRRFVEATDEKDFEVFPMSTLKFLRNYQDVLNRKFNGRALQHVFSQTFISETYEWLICWLMQMTLQKRKNMSILETDAIKIKNQSQVFQARTLSIVFAESNILMNFWEKCQMAEPELKDILKKLYFLFGLWCLHKHISLLYQGGYFSKPKLVDLICDGILVLNSQLKNEMVALTDALAPPDNILNSVLGESSGQVYEKLFNAFLEGAGTSARPDWWKEILPHCRL